MAWYDKLGLGIKVNRAAAADPQNVWQTLFTVAGGLIVVKAIVGVRTVIQAGGASTMQLRHSVGGVFDAGTLSVAADTVGTVYYLTGDTTDPIISGVGGLLVIGGRVVATSTRYGGFESNLIVGAGNIQVTMTAAAGTGSTRYMLWYTPLDDGATVVAA
ncbi:MAG: hypothetical protein PHI12_06950 [Dehalococcoidales bacterium]|nr:hypothetical protein [Dehalococcoidales bacterium]